MAGGCSLNRTAAKRRWQYAIVAAEVGATRGGVVWQLVVRLICVSFFCVTMAYFRTLLDAANRQRGM